MRYMTAGESHGKGLTAILEGFPSHVQISGDEIDRELRRRQFGYGRGGRMKIESDAAEILSGLFGGETLGSPITLWIRNRDFESWKEYTHPVTGNPAPKALTAVRPGHADFAGCVKYRFSDARNVLERASARETAARVAVGAICKQFLQKLGITIGSHVTKIGGVASSVTPDSATGLSDAADKSDVRCLDEAAAKVMREKIDECIAAGDTVGGEAEIIVSGMPAGVGSYVQYDRKLDAILALHLFSVQAVKSVAFGAGAAVADLLGSQVHDELFAAQGGEVMRQTNRAGGIEGGMTNGENIVTRIGIKPIPTLMRGLRTVDLRTGRPTVSAPERSDYCAVPAAGVVAEHAVAFALADELLKVTGGDDFMTVAERVEALRQRGRTWKNL